MLAVGRARRVGQGEVAGPQADLDAFVRGDESPTHLHEQLPHVRIGLADVAGRASGFTCPARGTHDLDRAEGADNYLIERTRAVVQPDIHRHDALTQNLPPVGLSSVRGRVVRSENEAHT
jgi:hypothetical protein